MNRVVVTGISAISPIGNSWDDIAVRLKQGKTGIEVISDWARYDGLNTQLGGPADFVQPAHYTRKQMRSMGRVAMLATAASEMAIEDAGLTDSDAISSGLTGVAYGSSTGSPKAIGDFGHMLANETTKGLNANSYLRMMAHTSAVNIDVFFGIKGRVITTSSACTSGSQGIGYAYEAIKYGHQQLMVAGGAEELCATEAAVFDTLFATSTRNEEPECTPRPFDVNRDGLVIGEGAVTLILESLEHATARGAHIYAELVGFGTNSDGSHVTQPSHETMRIAMELSLKCADLKPEQIGYISAHGTATDRGDIAESIATEALFGANTPISSLKSYTGHTLGACGALEALCSIQMMNEGWFHHTANLDNIDPKCAKLDYIQSEPRKIQTDYVMSNNFAFGGINTSLIFKRW